jgi:hypothetical protein
MCVSGYRKDRFQYKLTYDTKSYLENLKGSDGYGDIEIDGKTFLN